MIDSCYKWVRRESTPPPHFFFYFVFNFVAISVVLVQPERGGPARVRQALRHRVQLREGARDEAHGIPGTLHAF